MWLAEEWFRQAVAEYHRRRGAIVVFDRHFYADYYHAEASGDGWRPVASRIHGWLLTHAYPKPDLVICLDAPGQVLFDRKHEASAEWLEQRRRAVPPVGHRGPGLRGRRRRPPVGRRHPGRGDRHHRILREEAHVKILLASSIDPAAIEALERDHDVVRAFNASEDQLCDVVQDREVSRSSAAAS